MSKQNAEVETQFEVDDPNSVKYFLSKGRCEMILFLRSLKNKTMVDLEFWTKSEEGHSFHEIRVAIDLVQYSKFLLEHQENSTSIMLDFDMMDELRGWLWENYYGCGKRNTGSNEDYIEILTHLRKIFKEMSDKYNLLFVED